jgi:AraC-like DNA-binding protein
LRRICESLIAQPSSIDTLERWAEQIGASARTVARLFKQETGMSFGQWREQLRLTEAMSRLAIGRPVAQVAQDLGYADTRTFAVMFRRAMGATPHQFAGSDR